MSVNTRLMINSKYTIVEIQAVLNRTFETKTEYKPTFDGNYSTIFIEIGKDTRKLSVFHNSEHNGFNCTMLSLGYNGHSVYIMQALAHVFGGYLQVSDTDEDYKGYSGKLAASDGLAFWVRSAIIDGIDSDNMDALASYISKTEKKWSKNHEID